MSDDRARHEIDAAQEMRDLIASGGQPPTDADPFVIDGQRLSPAEVIEHLAPFMTEARRTGIQRVVAQRTRSVVPVVEGLVNTGNVSAVMRSAEALGCQDLHVVKGENERFKHSKRTAQGAQRWLDVWRWETPAACAEHLQARGVRVLTLALSDSAAPIDAFDFTAPTALVFGNEKDGVTDAMRQAADADCIIPMDGFTESFNVSVAAAVALYHARQDRLRRQGHHADLSDAAQERLTARFYLRSVSHAERILARQLREAKEDEASA